MRVVTLVTVVDPWGTLLREDAMEGRRGNVRAERQLRPYLRRRCSGLFRFVPLVFERSGAHEVEWLDKWRVGEVPAPKEFGVQFRMPA